MKYEHQAISNDEARKMCGHPNWVWFCENQHGTCFWNRATGEILWLAEKEGDSNYQKLVS